MSMAEQASVAGENYVVEPRENIVVPLRLYSVYAEILAERERMADHYKKQGLLLEKIGKFLGAVLAK